LGGIVRVFVDDPEPACLIDCSVAYVNCIIRELDRGTPTQQAEFLCAFEYTACVARCKRPGTPT
jgi:hypothetical protein